MAIYHLEAKVVSRGTGRSAVAASAYLSCTNILNDYDGVRHDYGDMDAFVRELKDAGYEKVELIKTCEGMFLEKKEALFLDLAGSTLLTGIK